MKQYVIIGTDTDCGKTYVTCRLVEYLRTLSLKGIALKPVASGMQNVNGIWQNEDVVAFQSLNQGYTVDEAKFWRFKNSISPHIAAKEEGISLRAKDMVLSCQNAIQDTLDFALIEGAGGVMAPLNSTETWLDFIQLSGMQVILVVGMRLGCLNHALLTQVALESHRIPCLGWIANCIEENMQALSENIATLQLRLPFPLLAIVSHQGTLQSVNLNVQI